MKKNDEKDQHNGCGHDHEHDCGHDHNHETIKLLLEDNSVMECDVLGIFDVGGQEYIAILPLGEENAMIYRYEETEEGPQLDNIESDEEYETVGQVFLAIMDEEGEFDEDEEDELE